MFIYFVISYFRISYLVIGCILGKEINGSGSGRVE